MVSKTGQNFFSSFTLILTFFKLDIEMSAGGRLSVASVCPESGYRLYNHQHWSPIWLNMLSTDTEVNALDYAINGLPTIILLSQIKESELNDPKQSGNVPAFPFDGERTLDSNKRYPFM